MNDTLDFFTGLGDTVASVTKAFNPQAPKTTAPAATPTNYKPWIIGGVALVAILVVVGLIVGRRS